MKWFHSIFTDGLDDGISSKRAVTIIAFMLCSIGFIADLFWDYEVNANVYEGMMYIVIAGLGFTASEKFARKNEDK